MNALEAMEKLCTEYGVRPQIPHPQSRVGLARAARTETPIHGERYPPGGGLSGWFIRAGEYSDAPNYYEPTRAVHIPEVCPLAAPFLGLPPGWRFISYGYYTDAWFDPRLLEVDVSE